VSDSERRHELVIEDKSKLDKFRIEKAKMEYVDLYNRLISK
jgi:hypothetical protein